MTSEAPIGPPPGGRLRCADNQTPIVEVDANGEVYASCVNNFDTDDGNPPFEPADLEQYMRAYGNWLIGKIRGEDRDFEQRLTADDYRFLEDGKFVESTWYGRQKKIYFSVSANLRGIA